MGNYLLQSYLDRSLAREPEKAALIDERGALSYRELHADAERMAHCLRGELMRQDRVVIWLKRSSRVVMAVLGVLKADAIYVPFDAKAPLDRLFSVIEDCSPAAIICEEAFIHQLAGAGDRLRSVKLVVAMGAPGTAATLPGMRCVNFEELPAAPSPPDYRNIDTDAAYILYTSGSTGKPKGVTVSHLNVTSYIDWAVGCFGIDSRDRVLGTAPFHFDMSTFDIFATLKAGATLCLAADKHLLFPGTLLDLMERESITIWKGVSSLLMYISSTGSLKPGRIPTLDRVLFGGEVLPTRHLINWMTLFPAKRYYNVYGPTETTGISAYHEVRELPGSAGEAIPIGRACANTEIMLLTEEGTLAAAGETGELCIRGSGVSLGYWNDAEKTARAFVPNPLGLTSHDRIYRSGDLARWRADGLLEYLGRKDFQVKFMGYRIETFEVEKAILSLESVRQAAVLLCGSPHSGVAELVAFIEGAEGTDGAAMLQCLGRSLPAYMVPRQIIALPVLPLTDRGKIDRGALHEHYRQLAAGGRPGWAA